MSTGRDTKMFIEALFIIVKKHDTQMSININTKLNSELWHTCAIECD
jgi:hypothetical protein